MKSVDGAQGALLEKYQNDNRLYRKEISELKEKMQVEFNKYAQVKTRMEDLLKQSDSNYDPKSDDLLTAMCEEVQIDPVVLVAGINKIKISLRTIG